MANICEYKVIVKGKKNACFAFYGSMSVVEDIWIEEETGSDAEYMIRFEGNCKWSVDSYCREWEGEAPVTLPEDPIEAKSEAEQNYSGIKVKDRSRMFNVEVLCNSADIEDYDPEDGPIQIFEHYISGEDAGGECPEELIIEGDDDDWD